MKLNRLLWQQSGLKCIGAVCTVIAAAIVVCFFASSSYQEGMTGLDDQVILVCLCLLPYLFLYWIVYLMWRNELVVMSSNGIESLAIGNAALKLFRSKIFLLAEIILPVFILSILLYVLINGVGANVLNIIYINLVCILALTALYFFNFLWANHIRNDFRRGYATLIFAGCYLSMSEQSFVLLLLTGFSAIVLIIVSLYFIRKEYS